MADNSVVLGELAEEFSKRVREGEMPQIEDYIRAHPALADRIRELFPTLLLLEGMAGARATASQRPEIGPGSSFANYRVERELGRGGMGIVYEAVHVALDKRVALKVLLMHSAAEATQLERFLREAKTAAGLHHTNIVPVFDVGQVGGVPYYAMQYIDGRGVDVVLRELQAGPLKPSVISWRPDQTTVHPGAPVPELTPDGGEQPNPLLPLEPSPSRAGSDFFRWVAELGIQAAEGIAYAHQRGVIHRDIKPSNLILDHQGVLWITDFGLARRKDDPSLTQAGGLLGTPRYMSPEQAAAARKPIDHRTDIYSLGATLYELLTRRPAFDGPTPTDVVLQILDREPIAPRRLNPAVPRDLETIVLKAMAKRPEDRYQDASELAADFRRWLKLEPITARRIGPVGRLVRWTQRNPQLAAVTASAAALILILSVVYVQGLRQEFANTLTALGLEAAAREKAEAAEEQAKTAESQADASAAQAKAAEKRAQQARELTQQRLEESLDILAMSLYQQARAVRASGQTGRRWEALPLLGRAAKLLDRPRRFANGNATTTGPTRISDSGQTPPTKAELRNETLATLFTRDARLALAVAGTPGPMAAVASKREVAVVVWHKWRLFNAQGGLRLIDLTTGKELQQFNRPEMLSLGAISPDAELLATMSIESQADKNRGFNVWELPTGTLLKKLHWPSDAAAPYGDQEEPGELLSPKFSPQGAHLAVVTAKGQIVVWDIKTGRGRVFGKVLNSQAFAFSPDGAVIAYCTPERDLKLLRLVDEKVNALHLPLPGLQAFAFVPSSQELVVACSCAQQQKCVLVFLDPLKDQTTDRFEFSANLSSLLPFRHLSPMAVDRHGAKLAMGDADGNICIVSLRERATTMLIHSETTNVSSVAYGLCWLADGRLVSANVLGSLNVWELATDPFLSPSRLTPGPGEVSAVTYSPDGKWVAVRHSDLFKWETLLINRLSGTVERGFPAEGTPLFSADSRYLACVNRQAAWVWDVRSGMQVSHFESKNDPIASAAFSADKGLVVARQGNGLTFYDVTSGKTVGRTPAKGQFFFLSPNSTLLAAINQFRPLGLTLSLWSVSDGVKREQITLGDVIPEVPVGWGRVEFSPDNHWLAVEHAFLQFDLFGGSNQRATASGTRISIWNLNVSKPRRIDIQDSAQALRFLFSPNSHVVMVGYVDGSVHLWDLAGSKEIARWKVSSGPIVPLAVSPDGATVTFREGQSSRLTVLDLAGLRKELATMNLDW
jgi:serine/threonine protein kinase/WD40 repeat protein